MHAPRCQGWKLADSVVPDEARGIDDFGCLLDRSVQVTERPDVGGEFVDEKNRRHAGLVEWGQNLARFDAVHDRVARAVGLADPVHQQMHGGCQSVFCTDRPYRHHRGAPEAVDHAAVAQQDRNHVVSRAQVFEDVQGQERRAGPRCLVRDDDHGRPGRVIPVLEHLEVDSRSSAEPAFVPAMVEIMSKRIDAGGCDVGVMLEIPRRVESQFPGSPLLQLQFLGLRDDSPQRPCRSPAEGSLDFSETTPGRGQPLVCLFELMAELVNLGRPRRLLFPCGTDGL